MQSKKRIIVPLVIVFIFFNLFFTLARSILYRWSIHHEVLIIANLVFFVASIGIFFMQKKALQHVNPNVFVRSVMGGMLIKMAVCVVAIIVYRLIAGNSVSKVSVFAAMFLYLIYLAIEIMMIMKLNKQKNG